MAEEVQQKQVLSSLCPSGRKLKVPGGLPAQRENESFWLSSPPAIFLTAKRAPPIDRCRGADQTEGKQSFCRPKRRGHRSVPCCGRLGSDPGRCLWDSPRSRCRDGAGVSAASSPEHGPSGPQRSARALCPPESHR